MAHATWPHCIWCEKHHAETHACPPVREYLATMKARGDSLTMPTLTFPDDPMPLVGGLGGPGDAFLSQLVVQGATVDVGGVPRAGLLFTGRDETGKPLPRWLYVDTDEHMQAAAQLVVDMTGAALTAARGRR